jgi:hypothetical protein
MMIVWMMSTLALLIMTWRKNDGTAERLQGEIDSLRAEIEGLRSELKRSRAEKS